MGYSALFRMARGAALTAALMCLVGMANAQGHDTSTRSLAGLFVQAETTKTSNHPRFLKILQSLKHDRAQLSPEQEWHLTYLNAYQIAFEGKLSKAAPILRHIIDGSGGFTIKVRAKALLVNILSRGHHYEEAYTQANELMSELPQITNPRARSEALRNIVQMLSLARQFDQALQYARRLEAESTLGEDRCAAYSYVVNTLYDKAYYGGGNLSHTSPALQKAIGICLSDKQMVYANTLRLDKADLLTEEGHPDQAIALLHRITPSIHRMGFQPHLASLHTSLALAHLAAGDDAAARKSALAALAISKNDGFNWPLLIAYKVLYQVAKKAGNDTAALSSYEKYVTLHDASLNDTKERTLAYQMVKQEVLAKKLKLEALTRQNRILQLRQALAQKAAETSRLYIALLVVVIILIGLWLYRLKHSQMRFRRMARHDDLTEAFNRKHFLDEAKRVLQRLSKDQADSCLIILDLDHFKRINDKYGHIAGDDVLKHAVEIGRRELRASDVFGRLGGEEFGILMPACSREQGAEIGERIRHALASTPIGLNTGESVTVSASFGLSCTDTSGYELVQLLIDADAALYAAKRGGRNRLVVGTGQDTPPAGPDQDYAFDPSTNT